MAEVEGRARRPVLTPGWSVRTPSYMPVETSSRATMFADLMSPVPWTRFLLCSEELRLHACRRPQPSGRVRARAAAAALPSSDVPVTTIAPTPGRTRATSLGRMEATWRPWRPHGGHMGPDGGHPPWRPKWRPMGRPTGGHGGTACDRGPRHISRTTRRKAPVSNTWAWSPWAFPKPQGAGAQLDEERAQRLVGARAARRDRIATR